MAGVMASVQLQRDALLAELVQLYPLQRLSAMPARVYHVDQGHEHRRVSFQGLRDDLLFRQHALEPAV